MATASKDELRSDKQVNAPVQLICRKRIKMVFHSKSIFLVVWDKL